MVTATTDEAHQNNKGTKMDTETTTEPTPRQVIEEFVKDSNMEQITHKMVQQMERIQSLQKSYQYAIDQSDSKGRELFKIRDYLGDKFRELMEGDKDATVEMDLDDFNEILTEIGASKIAFTWKVDVTATVTITGIEAESAEEAERKALEAVSLSINLAGAGDDADSEDEEYETDNAEEESN